ncbi:MAG: hypothetical protein GDA43_03105 [Hormoscilla sp. SP5CHS1]|nr:hypothetical protein [Hormoscilla sp. SP5CHS1]
MRLIAMIFNRVPNINDAIISVHCHDDRGYAVDNAIAALDLGVRQIECVINGLGARKGNAKLETVVEKILEQHKYKIEIDSSLMSAASDLVARISGRCLEHADRGSAAPAVSFRTRACGRRRQRKVNTYVKHKKPGLLNNLVSG